MICASASLVKPGFGWGEAVTLFCKRWTCPNCVGNCRGRLKVLLLSGEPDMFITLTAGPKAGATPDAAARTMVCGWRKLRPRIAKKLGINLPPFHLVMEGTDKGMPHLHILLRMPFLWKGWLSEQWEDLAGSPIVDIQRISSQIQAASYLSKYLTKVEKRFDGCHRHWGSRDWGLGRGDSDPAVLERTAGWQPDQRSLETVRYELDVAQYMTWMEGDTLVYRWPWPTPPGFEVVALHVQP